MRSVMTRALSATASSWMMTALFGTNSHADRVVDRHSGSTLEPNAPSFFFPRVSP
jgi:hypothetical protein